jgi:hypothetical protein
LLEAAEVNLMFMVLAVLAVIELLMMDQQLQV